MVVINNIIIFSVSVPSTTYLPNSCCLHGACCHRSFNEWHTSSQRHWHSCPCFLPSFLPLHCCQRIETTATTEREVGGIQKLTHLNATQIHWEDLRESLEAEEKEGRKAWVHVNSWEAFSSSVGLLSLDSRPYRQHGAGGRGPRLPQPGAQ